MKKVIMLIVGCALLGSATDAAAQNAKSKAAKPGYIGIRYDAHEMFMNDRADSRVIVLDVSKGSPAEKAGVRTGDEILRINGMAAGNGKFAAVARTLIEGDTVKLRVRRDTSEREYSVVAAARPAGDAMSGRTIIISTDSVRGMMEEIFDSARVHIDMLRLPSVRISTPGDSSVNIRIERLRRGPDDTLMFGRDTALLRELRAHAEGIEPRAFFERFENGPGPIIRSFELGARSIAGAEFTAFDPSMKSYFGTDKGLLTVRVAAETPAARAGLQPGDVVVKANDQPINDVTDLRELMWRRPETLKLEVVRKGETRKLEVPLQRKR